MDILIADDHDLVISGLIGALESAFNNASFSLAHDAAEVFRLLTQKRDYDIALVDLKMPGMDGFAFLQQLCDQYPELTVAVISGSDDSATIKKAISMGVSGFIPKSVSQDTLVNAVALMLRGDIFLPTHILTREASNLPEDAPPPVDLQNAYEVLTDRQREILLLLGDGQSNKEIARQLELSENTIKVHVSGILRALNLRNRTQAGVIGEKFKQNFEPDIPSE
jgi:DNA-binding NarL/FixJ family response regulator